MKYKIEIYSNKHGKVRATDKSSTGKKKMAKDINDIAKEMGDAKTSAYVSGNNVNIESEDLWGHILARKMKGENSV